MLAQEGDDRVDDFLSIGCPYGGPTTAMVTGDLWAFNAPELAGGQFHVYGPGR